MCDPVSIGLGVASTATSVIGQQQAANAQRQSQANASKAERQRYLAEVSSMRLQERQSDVAAAQKLSESARKATEARSTARVSAGEAGVAGLSVDALINDLTRKEAEYKATTTQQQSWNKASVNTQLDNAGLGFTNNMLRINKPIQEPNYLGAAVSGASTGLSAYSALK